MPERARPRLRIFPAEDVAFREAVDEALTEVSEAMEPGRAWGLEPEELQVTLRGRYPAAVVRPRETLADPGSGDVLWYVYRFGSVTPGRRWWEEPGHAWAILDERRQFVEVSKSFTHIVEEPRDRLIGQPIEALANPADPTVPEDAVALWEQMRRTGELHGSFRFRRADGRPRELEYHLTRDGAGPARHLAIVREVARYDTADLA